MNVRVGLVPRKKLVNATFCPSWTLRFRRAMLYVVWRSDSHWPPQPLQLFALTSRGELFSTLHMWCGLFVYAIIKVYAVCKKKKNLMSQFEQELGNEIGQAFEANILQNFAADHRSSLRDMDFSTDPVRYHHTLCLIIIFPETINSRPYKFSRPVIFCTALAFQASRRNRIRALSQYFGPSHYCDLLRAVRIQSH